MPLVINENHHPEILPATAPCKQALAGPAARVRKGHYHCPTLARQSHQRRCPLHTTPRHGTAHLPRHPRTRPPAMRPCRVAQRQNHAATPTPARGPGVPARAGVRHGSDRVGRASRARPLEACPRCRAARRQADSAPAAGSPGHPTPCRPLVYSPGPGSAPTGHCRLPAPPPRSTDPRTRMYKYERAPPRFHPCSVHGRSRV